MSSITSNNGFTFPLWLLEGTRRAENFSQQFRAFIDSRYDHHYTPEEILGYIYAVLHAPTYRTRYAEFLRIDFPRIPFPDDTSDFEVLSRLGWALVQVHLLREWPRQGLAKYDGKGDNSVEAVRYSPEDQAIAINKTQSFKPVPEDVWNFHSRRLSGARQVPEVAQGSKAHARRNRPRRSGCRQPCLHHRADGQNR